MATSALIPVQPVFLSKSDKERLAEMEKQRVAFNEQLEARKAALAQYNPLVERYNEQLAKYQEAVAPYNEAAAEYNRQLAQRQAAVDEYNRQLLARQTAESEYNKMVEGYEKERLSYNEMISPYNRAVEEYNKQLEAYKSSFLPGAKEGEIALLQRIDGNLYDAQGNPLPADTPYSSYAGLPENVFARRTSANYPSLPTVPAAYSGPAAPVAPVYKGPEVPVYGGPAEPTKPVYTGPAEPIKPVYTGPAEPVAPFTQESFEQFQQEAQGRAQQAAGQRALAADVYQDPSRFGLAGFAGLSARAFAKGGEVRDDEPRTKAGRMMKELGFSKAPKEKTLADEPSRQSPETLAYSLRAQSEANKDADLRRKTLAAPGALEVKRFKEGGESRKSREETPEERLEDRRASDIEFIGGTQRFPGLPEFEDIRSNTLGFIKRMDDASLMATASKMTGMPFSSPTQARVMLEKMLGDDAAISASLIGMGRNLPERVVGYSVGARMPAFGGQLNVGADIPRGPGSPMFNLGYTKQFQAGGEVEGNEEVPQGPITTPLRTRTRRPATQEENESLSRAMLQGLANLPYNVVGIPGDIANLLAAPTGKQPFYGSESAKALATRLGIRPAPPTDPTAAALYGAADIGSSLINPAAPVRAAAQGAERAGAALSRAAKDFQKYNRMLDVPGAAYAVKPKGGNWVDLERTLGLEKRNIMNPRPPGPDDSPFYVQNYKETIELDKSAKAINGWIDNKLTKYIRNNLGTTDDPVRAQLDRWELVEKPNLLSEKDRQIDKVMADIRRVAQERGVQPETLTRSQEQLDKLKQERLFIENQQGGFPFAQEDRPAVNPFLRMIGFGDSVYQQQAALARRQQGMPEAPLAKGDIAQEWEARSDTGIRTYPGPLMRELADPDLLKENPWLQKLGPDDKVYQLDSTQALNLPHVVDELLTALSPASGLPKKLQITPEELANSSVEKVFKLVDDIGAFRAVQRAEADKALAGNIATVPVKNYATVPGTEIPNTDELRWVQLKIPQPRPNYKIPPHLEIVKPTPSSETWAIYDNNRKQYITSGLPSPQAGLEHLQYMEGRQALKDALEYEGRLLAHCVGTYCPDVEKGDSQIFSLRNAEGRPTATIELTREGALSQIKGQNNAPPRAQLPFVLDFLREKNPVDATKGGLTDMHQMGIFHVTPNQRLPGFSKIIPPGFYTLDDFKQMALDNQMPEDILNTWMDKLQTLMKKGYAHGGLVNKHDAFIKAHA